MRTEEQYKNSQTRLTASRTFRYFWQFWAIYSFSIFVVVFAYGFARVFALHDDNSILWQKTIVLSVISFVLARLVLITIINLFYKRPRPYQKFNFSPITSKFFSFKTTKPNSFPSRHTIAYMAIAVAVLMFFSWIGLGLAGVAIMAGVGRVALGYHWPSDILVGAILGALVACFTVIFVLPRLFT